MNLPANLSVIVLALLCAVEAYAATPIKELALDEHEVFPIPVASGRVTTVSFPGPIAALDGAGITTDGKSPALFQLAHKPGAYLFPCGVWRRAR